MTVAFSVNGIDRSVEAPPTARLIDILRSELGLDDAPHDCANGSCGHCTVLLDSSPTRACLVPVFALRDRKVVTSEGLINTQEYMVIDEAFRSVGYEPCPLCRSSKFIGLYAILAKGDTDGDTALSDWLIDASCPICDSSVVMKGAQAAVLRNRNLRHERF